MLLLGSCLALNLSYSGCCVRSRTKICSNNGCHCHQDCHIFKTCCSDIADIGCYPASSFSPTFLPTTTDTLGKTKSEAPYFILINMCDKTMLFIFIKFIFIIK